MLDRIGYQLLKNMGLLIILGIMQISTTLQALDLARPITKRVSKKAFTLQSATYKTYQDVLPFENEYQRIMDSGEFEQKDIEKLLEKHRLTLETKYTFGDDVYNIARTIINKGIENPYKPLNLLCQTGYLRAHLKSTKEEIGTDEVLDKLVQVRRWHFVRQLLQIHPQTPLIRYGEEKKSIF